MCLSSYLNSNVYSPRRSISLVATLKCHPLALAGTFIVFLEHKSIAWWITKSFFFWFSPVAKPARITGHPQELKDAVSGKLCKFSVQVVGTEPLNYMWQCKIESGSEEWQSCDVESFPGANSPTLIIPSVQRSNEGSYRCTVSNCVGSETSECARLIVGELNHCTKLKISGSYNNNNDWYTCLNST